MSQKDRHRGLSLHDSQIHSFIFRCAYQGMRVYIELFFYDHKDYIIPDLFFSDQDDDLLSAFSFRSRFR